jgi:hypothetical protein
MARSTRRLSLFLLLTLAIVPGLARGSDDGFPAELTDGKNPAVEKVTYLGVTAKSVDDTLRAQLNLPDGTGLSVMTVDSKGPAAADVQPNDVLQKLDDQLLIDPHQLVTLIHLHHPGDAVTLTLLRHAKSLQVTIKLGEKERHTPAANDTDHQENLSGVKMPDDLTGRNQLDTLLTPNAQVAMSFKDDAYSATIVTDDKGRHILTVRDATAKVVSQGPMETPEDWNKLAPDIRTHLEMMHKMMLERQK